MHKVVWLTAVLLLPGAAFAQYSGGDGTDGDPYQISSLDDLEEFQVADEEGQLDAHFVVTADIDASETSGWNDGDGFEPVGDADAPFTGSFDGDGHVITGLTIDRPSQDDVGLFGVIGDDGQVDNLGLEDVDVTGNLNTGGLAGRSSGGILQGVFTSGQVSGEEEVGGVIGLMENGAQLSDAYSLADVSGDRMTGGVVGFMENSSLHHAFGAGEVSANFNVAGLAGGFNDDDDGPEADISGSYWDTESTGQGSGVGFGSPDGVEMLKTSLMSGAASEWNMVELDFDGAWVTTEGYAALAWQQPADADPDHDFDGGSGTAANPFEVATVEQLDHVRYYLKANFRLVSALDLSGMANWEPVGSLDFPFFGTFEGDSRVITGLTIDRPDENYVGLFGWAEGAAFHRVILEDVDVTGGDRQTQQDRNNTGALLGTNVEGLITESEASGTVNGDRRVGGLVGWSSGEIRDSHADGQVEGETRVGGLLGLNNNGEVVQSNAVSQVSGTSRVGGLVGLNFDGALVESSFAEGDVSGESRVGGLVGDNQQSEIRIANADGDVDGTGAVGGLVGNNLESLVTEAYAVGDVTGAFEVGGVAGWNDGELDNVYATGDVGGDEQVGGVVGLNSEEEQDADADSRLLDADAGSTDSGLQAEDDGGDLTAEGVTAGDMSTDEDGPVFDESTVRHAYSGGLVNGEIDAGGVAGENQGELIATFWYIDINEETGVDEGVGAGDTGGAEGLNEDEMTQQTTFDTAGWDFDAIWNIDEGTSFPFLQSNPPDDDPQPPPRRDVTFRVDMSVQEDIGFYRPDDGDDVELAGEFNNWSENQLIMEDENGDGVYEISLTLFGEQGTEQDYRYRVETGDDRQLPNGGWEQVGVGPQVVRAFELGEEDVDQQLDAVDFSEMASQVFAGGNGTVESPFRIASVEQLKEVRGMMASHFLQTGELDLSGENWEPLGGQDHAFIGVYDGGGHPLDQLTVDRSGQDMTGLFGHADGATLRHIHLTGADVTGRDEVGALAGRIRDTRLDFSRADGQVTGENAVGGLVGDSETSDMTDTYAVTDAQGDDAVGGLMGRSSGDQLSTSFAAGHVSGGGRTGGLVGVHEAGDPAYLYWDTETSQQDDGVGEGSMEGMTGLLTDQMTGEEAQRNMDGFDFMSEEVWLLTESYPALQWEDVDAIEPTLPQPKNLRIVDIQPDQVTIEWDDINDDAVDRIAVYRGTSSRHIAAHDTIDVRLNSYNDTAPMEDISFYTVASMDEEGNVSEQSEPVSYYNISQTVPESWDMVSVPVAGQQVELDDSRLLRYEGVYSSDSTLTAGNGYWMISGSSESYTVRDRGLERDTLDLREGWNLVGSLVDSVDTGQIGDPDAILTQAPVYHYDGSEYVDSDFVLPGHGHWIHASESGQVHLDIEDGPDDTDSDTEDQVAQQRMPGTDAGEDADDQVAAALVFSSEGVEKRFWLMEQELPRQEKLRYLLPPQAPNPRLDVRSSDGYRITASETQELQLAASSWPVQVELELHGAEEHSLRLVARDEDGSEQQMQLEPGSPRTLDGEVASLSLQRAEQQGEIEETRIESNYPNPFEHSTTVEFQLAERADVVLEVYSVLGEKVATIVDDELDEGRYPETFDASGLAAGVYVLRFRAGDYEDVQRMTVVR